MNHQQLAEQRALCRSLTDKPFGVNIMLMNPDSDALARVAAEAKVKVITTGAGNPGKYMELWKGAGSLVMPVVPGVALARRLVAAGADAVIAATGSAPVFPGFCRKARNAVVAQSILSGEMCIRDRTSSPYPPAPNS